MPEGDHDRASLEAENAALHRQVAELKKAVRHGERVLQAVIDQVPGLVYGRTAGAWEMLFINQTGAAYLGLSPGEVVGRPEGDFFPAEVVAQWHVTDAHVMETGAVHDVDESAPHEDGMHVHRSIKFPIRDEEGRVCAVGGISMDVTAQRRAEERVLEAHRAAIRELGTPIIPLSEGALVVPVVGAVDPVRARQLLERILEGVAGRRAGLVILDVTAAGVLDAEVASAILKAAQAVRLLGAQVVLTGISPAMARSLVTEGVDLGGILTLGSLQDGVKYALRQR
ncbi:PAS domain-containing protein [Chondromyces apiculatus]|uniref:Sulfate transporter/antisigma-factor antagonist STAS n=1 Tax=Chondromyces apiculatus DSM 436 TaxID=1192034 RepID=A0A017T652_9BACT|nr:PAS domain-containing protein [Chondromyces apiculatus]EYF04502.1 Sulfate transporter/antisigma-factor antagonist STAS [Chondromyces apiculatus DSM 436]